MTSVPYTTPIPAPYTLWEPPKPVGYWILYAQASPHTIFAMYHKPTPEQIENTQKLLGWTWRDAE